MSQRDWDSYVAVTTAIMAILAAVTSLRTSSTLSSILLEKNNSNYYQAKANKEWNSYLANDIVDRAFKVPSNEVTQQEIRQRTEDLEHQADESNLKANNYFAKNNHLTTAGTFFEVAIAISAMAILLRRKKVWIFSLFLAFVGGYFLFIGTI